MSDTFTALVGTARVPVPDAVSFHFDVQGERHRFAVHHNLHNQTSLAVSHWLTGVRVCTITPAEQFSAVFGGAVTKADQGRAALRRVIAKHGEARVRSALNAAGLPPSTT